MHDTRKRFTRENLRFHSTKSILQSRQNFAQAVAFISVDAAREGDAGEVKTVMKQWKMWIALAGLSLLGMPAFGADLPGSNAPAEPARPGTVNYTEGTTHLDGTALTRQSAPNQTMNAGDVLTTGSGKAEVLLTPGIFLRVGDHSAVKMISPDLEHTQVEVQRGRAGVEVDQIFPQNMIQIIDGGLTTQIMKPGYYEFDANQPEAMVFKGEAEVEISNGKWEKVKDHHELALAAGVHQKTVDFNANPANDDLYNWSSLRSHYLAEANNQIAGEYAYEPGFYPGWYWDPWTWDYTYLGWGPFLSPFGWGFYPWGGYYGGWGWFGHGFYGHPGYYGHGFAGRPGYAGHAYAGGGFHGGAGGGGFNGGGFAGGGGRR
jgi:hypothetical protein